MRDHKGLYNGEVPRTIVSQHRNVARTEARHDKVDVIVVVNIPGYDVAGRQVYGISKGKVFGIKLSRFFVIPEYRDEIRDSALVRRGQVEIPVPVKICLCHRMGARSHGVAGRLLELPVPVVGQDR